MSARTPELRLRTCDYEEAVRFHKKWHSLWDICPAMGEWYLSAPAVYCFMASDAEGDQAVLTFHRPLEPQPHALELRGFAIRDGAPKNTGSKSIAMACKMLRLLRPDVHTVITYSLTKFKLSLYRGSSFELVGTKGHFCCLRRSV